MHVKSRYSLAIQISDESINLLLERPCFFCLSSFFFFLKHKMDDEQKQASTHPSKIITDRGGEFVWHAFQQTLKDGDYGIDLLLMTKANESASKRKHGHQNARACPSKQPTRSQASVELQRTRRRSNPPVFSLFKGLPSQNIRVGLRRNLGLATCSSLSSPFLKLLSRFLRFRPLRHTME